MATAPTTVTMMAMVVATLIGPAIPAATLAAVSPTPLQ